MIGESAVNKGDLKNCLLMVQVFHQRRLNLTMQLFSTLKCYSLLNLRKTPVWKKDNLNCDFLFGRIFEPRFCIQKCQSAVQPTIARWNVDREKYRPWAGMPFTHTSTASNPLSLVIHVYHVLAAGFLFFSKQVWLIKAMSRLYDVLHLLQ